MRMSRRMGLLGGKKLPPGLPTLAELFADMTVIAQNGHNHKISSNVSVNGLDFDINPSMYVFAFCNDSFAIHHLQDNSKTILYRATDDRNATDIYIKYDYNYKEYFYYLSKSGSSDTSVYAGTIIAATFPSYTDDRISAVFGNISVKNSAGGNSSSTGTIYLSNAGIMGKIILTAWNGAMCAAPVTSPTEYICTLDKGLIKARNYVDSSKTYLSINGNSGSGVNGGTILTI